MSEAARPRAVLLDTCAAIWLAHGHAMTPDGMAAIVSAVAADAGFVSPISAWEIGLLSRPRRGRPPAVAFLPDAATWYRRFLERPGIRLAEFTPEIAIDAAALPGDLHGDPADRFIVATARQLGLTVVTRDAPILAYAAAGHVQAIR